MLRGCTQRRTCPVCCHGLELMRKGHKSSTCRAEEKAVLDPDARMWLSPMSYSHLLVKIYLCKEMLKQNRWEWSSRIKISGQWRNSQTQWIILQVNFMFLPINFGDQWFLVSLENVENKGNVYIRASCMFQGELSSLLAHLWGLLQIRFIADSFKKKEVARNSWSWAV